MSSVNKTVKIVERYNQLTLIIKESNDSLVIKKAEEERDKLWEELNEFKIYK